ncbi:MAG: hypothetical protein KAV87_16895 [Desulfobacteraceae bacterium]|nr:hypothetical protein [Desulfobacteraceae bacterium]
MVKYQKVTIIVVALVCFISGFISGVYVGKFKDIPFMKRIDEWSIEIYTGKDPFNLVSPDNISNWLYAVSGVRNLSYFHQQLGDGRGRVKCC